MATRQVYLRTCPWCASIPIVGIIGVVVRQPVLIACSGSATICEVAPAVTGRTIEEAAARWSSRIISTEVAA